MILLQNENDALINDGISSDDYITKAQDVCLPPRY